MANFVPISIEGSQKWPKFNHNFSCANQTIDVCIVLKSVEMFNAHSNMKVAKEAKEKDRAKKTGFELKYVWQHANRSTSAFCIVVDNRYRIPLPKRIQNVLSYGTIWDVWSSVLFVSSHPKSNEKDILRLWPRYIFHKVQQIRFACFLQPPFL